MAVKTLTIASATKKNAFVEYTAPAVATSTTDGFEITFNKADEKVVLLVDNTGTGHAAATLTFKAGNGLQGTKDIVINVTDNKTGFITIDSGYFKNVYGTNKGKVFIVPSDLVVKVAVICHI